MLFTSVYKHIEKKILVILASISPGTLGRYSKYSLKLF